jgi:hypothetical protein
MTPAFTLDSTYADLRPDETFIVQGIRSRDGDDPAACRVNRAGPPLTGGGRPCK